MNDIIYLYPMCVNRIGTGKYPFIGYVVPYHTNKEWEKLLKEFKEICNSYKDIYGITVKNVKMHNKDFIECRVTLSDKIKFSNWGDETNLIENFINFINHNLNSSGMPSFYKDNDGNGKYIHKFFDMGSYLYV